MCTRAPLLYGPGDLKISRLGETNGGDHDALSSTGMDELEREGRKRKKGGIRFDWTGIGNE